MIKKTIGIVACKMIEFKSLKAIMFKIIVMTKPPNKPRMENKEIRTKFNQPPICIKKIKLGGNSPKKEDIIVIDISLNISPSR